MRDSYKSAALIDELVTRILCDISPRYGRADAIYLFGESQDNEASSHAAGGFLWSLGLAKWICITEAGEGFSYSGFNSWKKKLVKRGVPMAQIKGIPQFSDLPASTDAEAISLVRFAEAHNLRTVYVVAHPIHQLRVFISCVSAAKREKSQVYFFNFVGPSARWEDHITFSQGVQRGTRSNLIRKELKKIERYFKKGDLISPKGVLEYMNRRDRNI